MGPSDHGSRSGDPVGEDPFDEGRVDGSFDAMPVERVWAFPRVAHVSLFIGALCYALVTGLRRNSSLGLVIGVVAVMVLGTAVKGPLRLPRDKRYWVSTSRLELALSALFGLALGAVLAWRTSWVDGWIWILGSCFLMFYFGIGALVSMGNSPDRPAPQDPHDHAGASARLFLALTLAQVPWIVCRAFIYDADVRDYRAAVEELAPQWRERLTGAGSSVAVGGGRDADSLRVADLSAVRGIRRVATSPVEHDFASPFVVRYGMVDGRFIVEMTRELPGLTARHEYDPRTGEWTRELEGL